jgi:hypothetical protein
MSSFNFQSAALALLNVDFIQSMNSLAVSFGDGLVFGSNPMRGCRPVSSMNRVSWVAEWTWLL